MEGEAFGHTPVLVEQVCTLLAPEPGQVVVDATIGTAGHASLFVDCIGEAGTLIGLDVDPKNLAIAGDRLANAACRVELCHGNFRELADVLRSIGVEQVDVLFADLGVSSTQLDDVSRGFSFRGDAPLDMRLDPRLKTTAADLVNRVKERELGDLLYFNAQETQSRRIAKRICNVRREGRITRTEQLVRVVCDALHVNPLSRKSKIHPATRTFQALRMAVNDEIPCLESLLKAAPALLKTGGRIGVIAFHSVEDRPVKLDFRGRKNEGVYGVVTKKPVVADAVERQANPRSRSAKLRVAVRLPSEQPIDA